jgi:hypothetical protein
MGVNVCERLMWNKENEKGYFFGGGSFLLFLFLPVVRQVLIVFVEF